MSKVETSTCKQDLWNVCPVVTPVRNGSQRYFCPQCQQTFNERFGPLHYHPQVSLEQIRQVLQALAKAAVSVGLVARQGWLQYGR